MADHWPGLYLDGQASAVHELLAGFPAGLAPTMPGWRWWLRPMS